MSRKTWDELVALGNRYIQLKAEIEELEDNPPPFPDFPEIIINGDEYANYLTMLEQYERERDEHNERYKAKKQELFNVGVQLNDSFPKRIWIDVGEYSICVDPLNHAQKIRYIENGKTVDIPF